MLTVEDYAEIRRARRDGMTIREISRTFRRSRLRYNGQAESTNQTSADRYQATCTPGGYTSERHPGSSILKTYSKPDRPSDIERFNQKEKRPGR